MPRTASTAFSPSQRSPRNESKAPSAITVGLCVGGVVLVVVVVAALMSKSTAQASPHTQMLLKNSARWAAVARDGTNPVLKLTHVNYAMAYLNAARHSADDATIASICGAPFAEFSDYVESIQSDAMASIAVKCPDIAPANGLEGFATGWLT